MLSLYYRPELPEDVRVTAQRHWVDALGSLPAWAVAEAISRWCREEARRPTPADIRGRVIAMTEEYHLEARRRAPPEPPPPPPADPVKVRQMLADILGRKPLDG